MVALHLRVRAGLVVLALGLLLGVGLMLAEDRETADGVSGAALVGRVVDEQGTPVAGATVDLAPGVAVHTDQQGRFRGAAGQEPRLITAHAPDHLSRTLAAVPATPTEIALTSDAARTVSLRFGGDVMFGRRYFDPDEDGDRRDALLPPGATVAQHASLLKQVAPLLADADLTVVNLETPLTAEPWFDATAARPPRFHPTKEFVFASAPESAQALLQSGVDAVSLGNNHVFDALGPGMESTLAALDRAGMPHFGGGRTLDEAWAPALVERKGERVALLGCTTITGTEHAIPYVADNHRGGAARCTAERLAVEVRAARERADIVVVMVHGGEEYVPEQTDVVRQLSQVAAQAGAALVVNGHPHVVGGLRLLGPTPVAETMGNLLFDQTVWPTFLSYLLRVDLRAGVPVLGTVDPLLLEGFVPRPSVGVVADAAARRAAGLLPGPWALVQPGAAFAPGRTAPAVHRQETLSAGSLLRLPTGWWVDAVPAGSPIRLGQDLLWTGSFEDMDTDPKTSGAELWSFGDNVEQTPSAACSGANGMELRRSPVSQQDVVLTPTHRQLVAPGGSLSLLAAVRGASSGATLELALFTDTEGPSNATLRVRIPAGERDAGACEQVRLDAVLPPGIVAVQPYVRLAAPPGDLRAAHLAVDDLRLVAWSQPGASGRLFDTVEAQGEATLSLRADGPAAARTPFTGGSSTAR
ncbi:MAG: hypothetical protein JWL64_2245 [Frankiales bacterium]|nr:hypothetical protein [Frankiales bacterium]